MIPEQLIEQVKTKNGLQLPMMLLNKYPKGKLFFSQDRLCVTNLHNCELLSEDILDLVEDIL